METKLRNINELKLHPNNPRIIQDDKYEKLVQSLKDFPEMLDIRPLVIDENDMVLGGNQRLKAAKDAGIREIPTIQVNFTEEQKTEFIIKDNSSYGEWNWDILKSDWDISLLQDWAIDLPSYMDGSFKLDDFFEEVEGGGGKKEEKLKLVLEYTEEEYEIVVSELEKINKNKEKALWEILKLA